MSLPRSLAFITAISGQRLLDQHVLMLHSYGPGEYGELSTYCQ